MRERNENIIQHEEIINNKIIIGEKKVKITYTWRLFLRTISLLTGAVSVMEAEKLLQTKSGVRESFYPDLK